MTDLPRVAGRDHAEDDHGEGRKERGLEHAQQSGCRDDDKGREHGAHDHRLVASERRDPFEGSDGEEVAAVTPARREVRRTEHQQHVARTEDDVAELRVDALAGAMDGHDRRFVPGAKADLLEGRARERRARPDHDLEELSSRVVVDDREVWLRRGAQPRDPLEIDDPVDVAGEHEARAATQHAVGRNRRDGARLVVELDEIDALEVAQAGLGDGPPDERAPRGDDHLHRERSRGDVLARSPARRDEAGGDQDQERDTSDRDREAHGGDLEQVEGRASESVRRPDITTFVVVPMAVTSPPSRTAAFSAIRYHDGDRLLRRAHADTCGATMPISGVL